MEKLARELLIGDLTINNVMEEFQTREEQTSQLLNQWRKANPSKKWRDIKTALVFCNRNDMVGECERSRFFYFKELFFFFLFQ